VRLSEREKEKEKKERGKRLGQKGGKRKREVAMCHFESGWEKIE
jgi:hypothetical protein